MQWNSCCHTDLPAIRCSFPFGDALSSRQIAGLIIRTMFATRTAIPPRWSPPSSFCRPNPSFRVIQQPRRAQSRIGYGRRRPQYNRRWRRRGGRGHVLCLQPRRCPCTFICRKIQGSYVVDEIVGRYRVAAASTASRPVSSKARLSRCTSRRSRNSGTGFCRRGIRKRRWCRGCWID